MKGLIILAVAVVFALPVRAQDSVVVEFDSGEGLAAVAPQGLAEADYSFGVLPPGSGGSGQGLIVTLQGSDGLLVFGPSVDTGPGDVLLEAVIRTTGARVALFVVGLNAPPDGSQITLALASAADYVDAWGTMKAIYDPPGDSIIPALQVVALSDVPTTVYIESIVLTPIQSMDAGQVLDLFGVEAAATPTPTPTVPPSPDPEPSDDRIAIEIPGLASDAKPFEMALIPSGTYMRGSAVGEVDEDPPREIEISRSFYMSALEVTQAQWEAVMGSNPSLSVNPDQPVERVSWFDSARFCNRLSELDGRTPVYNESTWTMDPSANGFRLPTEAEWEYACRAGTDTAYSFGDAADCEDSCSIACEFMDPFMVYCANSNSEPQPAGSKLANPWGLYDMHGNVFEWCGDWYGAYQADQLTDPGGAESGNERVLRGGSFNDPDWESRSANRGRAFPNQSWPFVGFRIATNSSGVDPEPTNTPVPGALGDFDGLSAYYKFDGNLDDSSGSERHADGEMEYGVGVYGEAYDFNEVDDALILPPPYLGELPEYTIEMWIVLTHRPANATAIFTHESIIDGRVWQFQILQSDETLNVQRVINMDPDTPSLPIMENLTGPRYETGEWMHLAIVYSSASQRVYADGRLARESGPGAPHQWADGSGGTFTTLGAGFISGPFGISIEFESLAGGIDELRFWNHARTEEQIRDYMGQTIDPSDIPAKATPTPTPAPTSTPTFPPDSDATATPTIPGEAEPTNTPLSTMRVSIPRLPEGAQPLEMVLIPAGDFVMGSPPDELDRDSDEGPQHVVRISEPFWMSKYEITNAQYLAYRPDHESTGSRDMPVSFLTSDDAREFCEWLTHGIRRIPPGTHVYRLPSEAEWEYACRAGTTAQRYWGGDTSDLDVCSHANVIDLSFYVALAADDVMSEFFNTTERVIDPNSIVRCYDNYEMKAPVGQFPPNAFGLYDMLGNVAEYCEDDYHVDYSGAPVDGSAWIDSERPQNVIRVYRGGSHANEPALARSASRAGHFSQPSAIRGFRVVSRRAGVGIR